MYKIRSESTAWKEVKKAAHSLFTFAILLLLRQRFLHEISRKILFDVDRSRNVSYEISLENFLLFWKLLEDNFFAKKLQEDALNTINSHN